MKGIKWEPAALMVLLLVLGAWIAFSPDVKQEKPVNAERAKLAIGTMKGVLEWEHVSGVGGVDTIYRIHSRDGATIGPLTQAQLDAVLGKENVASITAAKTNAVYRALNVTSPIGVAWVVLGFVGQLAFSGRWLLQWFVSEKSQSSTVPVSFWWLSLVGSAMLFAYFVWRNDVVGVLGQTSGVVIYARNIRLIAKQKRRAVQA